MKKYLLGFVLLYLVTSCSLHDNNEQYKGYEKGVWKCTDSTKLFQIILQDSSFIVITPNGIIGNPELYGKKKGYGVRPLLNFKKNPIEFCFVYNDSLGKPTDTTKFSVKFLSKDTMQLTFIEPKINKKKIDKSSKTSKDDGIFTFSKTDTSSTIPSDIRDITKTIYKLYSNFSYNNSALDNFDSDKIPVYGNMLEISWGLGVIKIYTMQYVFDAHDIFVYEIKGKEAFVHYKIDVIKDGDVYKTMDVNTTIKKINNEWRVRWDNIFGDENLKDIL